jgi:drug/metabolite transporter (DMT)-like permease
MSRSQANKLLLLAAFLWGAGNVAQQTILENIGPFLAVGLRCLIAAIVILPFTLGTKKFSISLNPLAKRLRIVTIVTFTAAVAFQQIGFGYTTVTNAGFIVNTTTVITPLIAWTLLLQPPLPVVWPAAILTLTGAGLMSGGSIKGFNIGDLFCLASAVCFSLWMVFLGEFVSKYGNALRLTLIQFFASGLICLGLGLIFETLDLRSLQAALPELLILGMLSTGAAYLLQSIAQKYTSASEAAVITSGEAFFGAMGAFLMLGETPSALGVIGAALICSGILIVQFPFSKSGFLTRQRMASAPAKLKPSRSIPSRQAFSRPTEFL